MGISVVVTVLNEAWSLSHLLKTLQRQTKKPAEIVVVDGGSEDGTIKEVRVLQQRYTNIKLLIKKGANRSRGRNSGIALAQGPIIAVTDAGCTPEDSWLENLTAQFRDSGVDVVSGYYLPSGESVFQKSFAVYTCVLPPRLNPQTFLPSSRSIAFRKRVWKRVGGYPEYLETCEDLIFVDNLKKERAKFVFATGAVVYWTQKNTWKDAFLQLYGYAKGDVAARYAPHLQKIALVWLRYVVAIFLLVQFPVLLLFFLPQYVAWVIAKGYWFVNDKRALVVLPLLQLVSDLAVMTGSLGGLLQGKKKALLLQ